MSTTNQHFCLKWNNHQNTLISLFSSLLDSNTFVDCTLAAGGKQLKVHKMILSACSPYFKEILLEHSDVHPIIILNNVQYSELVAIVEFMYRGEVNVSQEQLSVFLRAANALQVKGLTNDSERLEEVVRETLSDYSGYQSSGDERIVKTERDDDSHSLPGPSTSSDISGFMGNEQNTVLNTSDYSSPSFIGLLPQNYEDSLSGLPSQDVSEHSKWDHSYTQEAAVLCYACGKSFKQRRHLKRHLMSECLKQQPGLSCPHCSYVAAKWNMMTRHMKLKHCSYQIISYGKSAGPLMKAPPRTLKARIQHYMEHHFNDESGMFECVYCARAYPRDLTLYRHLVFECLAAPILRRNVCPYCTYKSRSKRSLIVHMAGKHKELLEV